MNRRWHLLAMVVGCAVLATWLARRPNQLGAGATALAGASPAWLLVAVAAAVAVQMAAATALQTVAPTRLSFTTSCRIQLAGSAAAALTPGGVGGAALHAVQLERAGGSRAGSWAAVIAVRSVTTALHVLALAVALPLARHSVGILPPVPGWLTVVALPSAGGAAVVAWRSPRLRRRLAGWWAQRPPAELLRRRAVGLASGAGGTTLARGVTLWASLRAVGIALPLSTVLVVFLVADAAGAVSGAPNGLGAFDVAVLAALEAATVGTSAGLAGLVLHRLLTVWLPILPGSLALAALSRAEGCRTADQRGPKGQDPLRFRAVRPCQ